MRVTSLGRRLLLAFLAIAGLPALTGALGWFELRDVAEGQSEVFESTIPALAEMQRFAVESARIVAVAPELAAVTVEDDRRDRAAYLHGQVEALKQRLERYVEANGAGTGDLARAIDGVQGNIAVLDELVRNRIALSAHRDLGLQEALAATTQLLDMADTLVANAQMGTSAVISNLYELDGAGTVRDERLDTLDKLIEVDLFQLGLMFELRSLTAEVGLSLNQIPGIADHEGLAEMRDRVQVQTDIMQRRIAAIRDPGRAEQAQTLLATIRKLTVTGHPQDSIIAASDAILDLRKRIAAGQADIRLSTATLGLAAEVLARRSQQGAVSAMFEVMTAMRNMQQRNTWASGLALIMSVAILWFYIRGNISRRIDLLSAQMAKLAAGRLDRAVVPTGRDEIAGMERAVEIFRKQAIANRELEAARRRNEEELRRHRSELQALVAEQTDKLRGEVAAHAEARAKAETADRSKSEFLAMMSHEIRTPMNGLLGMLRNLRLDGLDKTQRSQLGAARSSGESLLTILNDILDYSKFQSGEIVEDISTFSVGEMLRGIVGVLRPSAQEKGIALWLDVAGDVPDILRGDAGKLRQILFNLASNALKFTQEGEIVLRLRQVGTQGARVRLAFEVSDTGKGIAPDARQRIFDAFEQEDSQTARQYGGTGLGLAISRKFADVIGGQLSVESTPNVGSIFTLRVAFPIGDAQDLEVAAQDWRPAAAEHALRALVVEDHQINQMVAQSYLERMGHTAECVASGEEALERLREGRFDLVLMDVNLPGISGVEATRRIRSSDEPGLRDIPVIGISAHVQRDQIDAHLAAGMTCFVAKPVSPERLAAAIASVAEGQGPSVFLSPRDGDWQPSDEGAGPLASAVSDLGGARALAVAELFLDTLEVDLERLRVAVGARDLDRVVALAHRMKGAAGNFELPDLVACLQQIETQARDGEGATLGDELERLEPLAAGAAAALAAASAGLGPQGATGAVR
ncbi:ATP-binding protein [Albidovulum sediminicola]|uniref:histidine kinase n=1 Tax=Albidovulum sediminicola TaxID=2984331 RepID=A0ABT2Z655_9RHOB|nr:ATP-binding protein [Defluviimonas sp. WL0075]MCV2866625.1 ATP-binding protein [Defluviimonas sp. WL0075]